MRSVPTSRVMRPSSKSLPIATVAVPSHDDPFHEFQIKLLFVPFETTTIA
jgi:hypothetical protein